MISLASGRITRYYLSSLFFYATLVASGTLGLLYWFFVAFYRGDDPLPVKILYRFGDPDYLPLIYSLSRGNFREFIDPASSGTGLLPFPIFSILPYAIGVAVFGDAGFPVVDAALSVTRFLLFFTIIYFITGDRTLSAAASLAVIPILYSIEGWAFRYPRP